MIYVTFTPMSVEMKGHAHYANAGQDIVCAAASATAISLLKAIDKFIAKADGILEENEGYLYFEMTKLQPIAAALLLTMKETLKELETQFPKQIQVKENPLR